MKKVRKVKTMVHKKTKKAMVQAKKKAVPYKTRKHMA